MSQITKREFLSVMAAATASGMSLGKPKTDPYALAPFGNARLLHMTDCHAQLLPHYFREPSVNLGVASMKGQLPHLVGKTLVAAAGLREGSREAHAFTYLDFERAAKRYGKLGGFAHLATLVKRLRAEVPQSLLLDGGDTWQGSATALWSRGQDMVDACKLLGVEIMTGHWEFTLGDKRVKEIVEQDFAGKVEFVAQNVKTSDFNDPVFKPYTIRELGGARVAIIGQAFPYTPIANPRYFTPEWTFGIAEKDLQAQVDEVRAKGVAAVVLLSHNGMDVDLKLASRLTGIDVILGGHTHDGVPVPVPVGNPGGKTWVTNAGCNGKFLGVLDFDFSSGKLREMRYRLLPVFSNELAADKPMSALIEKIRAPHLAKLQAPLARTDGLLYRRGNFNGTWDQLLCDALMETQGAEMAFSPGFRWGTSLLPGQTITREHLLDQTAITYPHTTVAQLRGDALKTILEDVADNLFNADPYYQQGGDMVRVGGLKYRLDPTAKAGERIDEMRLNGQLIDPNKRYSVAGWAPVSEEARAANTRPVWEPVEEWLRTKGTITARKLNTPRLKNVADNQGMAH